MAQYRFRNPAKGEFVVTLVDNAGLVLLHSGPWPSAEAAKDKLLMLRMCCSYPAYYRAIDEPGGKFTFRVHDIADEPIATGRFFSGAPARDAAMRRVLEEAPGAAAVDWLIG